MAAATAALRLTITAAGRAALRNAQGNGTNKVLVATAGLTSTAFTPGDPVPAEIKRVATIAGGATAADTIHVTISDTSGDAFPILGFGLYLDDGMTLLASYGQATAIVEKSAQAAALIAVDIQFADVDATQITFGDTNFNNPAATTETLGVVELATDDETVAGTDPVRVVTPAGLLAAINSRLGNGAPSAFVKSLLTAVSATAFRVALGIKSAATFDTGAGNKLDADLLDGQEGTYYLDWGNLTGVPADFKPSAHQHPASDITSGIFPVARGGTGLSTVTSGNYLMGAANGTDPLVARAPAQVLSDIGGAAKSHSHTIANVTGLQDALNGKPNVGHRHVISDVANLQSSLDAKANLAGASFTGSVTASYVAGTTYVGAGAGANGAGTLDVRTGKGGFLVRTMSFTGGAADSLTIDGVDNSNSDFGPLNFRSTLTSFLTTTGTRILFRDNGAGVATIDAVNATNSAFAAMNFVSTGFTFNGSIQVNGNVTSTGGYQYSDRRLKRDIKRAKVHRGIALKMAKAFRSWRMKNGGMFDKGLIAQWVHKNVGHYVCVGADKEKLLGIDKSGLALEGVMDNALSIHELEKRIVRLERRT